jgi:hypothetical protein
MVPFYVKSLTANIWNEITLCIVYQKELLFCSFITLTKYASCFYLGSLPY